MTVHRRYPKLYLLAHLYFSEDWPDFYNDEPAQAIDAFIADEVDSVKPLVDEIEELLATAPSEADLAALFEELDLLYDPPSMGGQSHQDWLLAVSERVRATLGDQA